MENSQEDIFTDPSFSSYSSNRLSEIAVRVAAENDEDNNDDIDFEFSMVREDKEFSAEGFACDGQIGPIFPVFGEFGQITENKRSKTRIDVPLSKLLFEDRNGDDIPSRSSSEADELENIPAGTYCVWRPKAADQPSPSPCKKSNSTGSALKRWKLRDLMRRSNSEGKDRFVLLTPKNREGKSATEAVKKGAGKGVGGSVSVAVAAPLTSSAHEALYIRNRMIKEGDKKKSYLPYRRDLVGFFVNVNALGRGYPHL